MPILLTIAAILLLLGCGGRRTAAIALGAGALLLPAPAAAQFTTVTGTVKDSLNNPYAHGTIGGSLIPPPGSTDQMRFIGTPVGSSPVPGSVTSALDANGSFSVSMADNNQITPSGSKWRITICSKDRVVCFVTDQTITGATLDLSATLSALAPSLTQAVAASTLIATGVPWYDIRAYGAVGGSPTVDTAGFQAAMNACQAKGYGIVYVAPTVGSYQINAALTFTSPAGSGYCEVWQANPIDYSAVTTTTTIHKGWKIRGLSGVLPGFSPGPKQQWTLNTTNPPNPIFLVDGGPVEFWNLKLTTVKDTTGLIVDTSTAGGTMVVLDGVEIVAFGNGTGQPLIIRNTQWVYVRNAYIVINPGTNLQPAVWVYSGHSTASDGTTTGIITFKNVLIGKTAIKLGHPTLGPANASLGNFVFNNVIQEAGEQALFQLDLTNNDVVGVELEGVEEADQVDASLPLFDDISGGGGGAGHLTDVSGKNLIIGGDFYRPPSGNPSKQAQNVNVQTGTSTHAFFRTYMSGVSQQWSPPTTTATNARRSGFIVEGWTGGLGQTGGIGGALGEPTTVVATPSASGGSCADGTYFFTVTSVSAETGWTAESRPSLEVACTVSGGGGSGKCALTWDAIAGAASYRVYGTGQMTGYATQNKSAYVTSTSASKDYTCSGTTGGSPPLYTQHLGQGKSFWLNPLGSSWFMNRVGFGTVSPGTPVDVVGKIRTTTQFESTQAPGTPPLVVASTTPVPNLNADMVDSLHAGPNAGTDSLQQGTVAYKTIDESVTSSTTVQDDDHLAVTMLGSTKYRFRLYIFTNNAGAAEGFRCTLGGTVTVTQLKAQVTIFDDTLNSMAAFARITALGTEVAAGLGSGDNLTVIEGTIETGTGGTLRLRWAQNVSGANATTVQRNSYMEVVRVQ